MISPLIKKLVAVSVLAVFGWLLLAALVLPYLGWTAGKRASIEALRLDLARYETVAQKAVLYEAALESADPGQIEALLVGADSPALARAALQDGFNTIASALNIENSNVRPLDPALENGLVRIGFRVSFRASAFDLLELLKGLRSAETRYQVENLKVKAPDDQAGQSQPVLNIQMDVRGFTEAPDA